MWNLTLTKMRIGMMEPSEIIENIAEGNIDEESHEDGDEFYVYNELVYVSDLLDSPPHLSCAKLDTLIHFKLLNALTKSLYEDNVACDLYLHEIVYKLTNYIDKNYKIISNDNCDK